MSEGKSQRNRKIPSGCPSPARMEKTDSSSSRQTASPVHWDFEPIIPQSLPPIERPRPSSWDDSDDELSSRTETEDLQTFQMDSKESTTTKGSISSEINELKKQFFESLVKENSSNSDRLLIDTLMEKLEMKFKGDRRQSPARIRRRSKSSSSSSPVAETKCQNSPEASERPKTLDDNLYYNYLSPKAPELDTGHYLNNFFSGLRSKRISMLEPSPVPEKAEKDGMLMCDDMKLEMLNDLNTLEMGEDDGYCKTSRKLSQILEVEESRKDPGKGSEENLARSRLANVSKKMKENDNTPHQTATNTFFVRSKKSEKVVEDVQKKSGGYKSMSFEELKDFPNVGQPSQGSLSERSARFFANKIDDDYIRLCAKRGKTRLNSCEWLECPEGGKPLRFHCLADVVGVNHRLSKQETPRGMETGNLKIDLIKPATSRSPTPRRSSDRSEESHTSRRKSGKSRSGSNPQSPRFKLNLDEDSGRSLGKDGFNTPDSKTKREDSCGFTELKGLLENSSGRKSDEDIIRSDKTYSMRSGRNFNVAVSIPSKEPVKSAPSHNEEHQTRTSSSGQTSRRSKTAEVYSITETVPIQQTFEDRVGISPNASGRTSERDIHASHRSESLTKGPRSPKSPEEGSSSRKSHRRTSRSPRIVNFELRVETIDRPEPSSRQKKKAETEEAVKDTSHMSSERNSSARSRRSGKSRRSTARSIRRSATPSLNGDISVRSNDSYQKEKLPVSESGNDTPKHHGPASRGSIYREVEVPTEQPSSRSDKTDRVSEYSCFRETFTPKLGDTLEEHFSSRKGSARSTDSCGGTSFGNGSPGRSERVKSRPSTRNSQEHRLACTPHDIEKLDIETSSGRTTNRSFVSEEEEREEIHSTRGSMNGTESDRHSIKQLSIINEVSLEDTETSNASTESEEKNTWQKSRPSSRMRSKRSSSRSTGSAKTVTKGSPETSGRSYKSKLCVGSSPHGQCTTDKGTWTDLIQTFEGNPNSVYCSEKNFPGYPPQNDENPVKLRSPTKHFGQFCEGDDGTEKREFSLKMSRRTRDSKMRSSRNEINQNSGRGKDQKQEEDFDFSSVYKDPLLGKKSEDDKGVGSPQNLYYAEVEKGGAFGMGGFGDMTCWSGGKSDPQDLDIPKDHGDGIQAFRSSEVLLLKADKREKETKSQRQPWTELKENFHGWEQFFNDAFFKLETHSEFSQHIPTSLKTYKSDNCINRKLSEGSECHSSATCEFSGLHRKRGRNLKSSRKRDAKTSPRNRVGCYSSGSIDSPKEESDTAEFDSVRTPRLSRSMSDLHTSTKVEGKELGESVDFSQIQPFEKVDFSKEEKEFVDLSLFLARKQEEEVAVLSNNWLNIRKSDKREKKRKIKAKKSTSSSGEHFIQYLSSRKSRSTVPILKLRNPNCFQNFYKRFISVFCVTSNSSAATSK